MLTSAWQVSSYCSGGSCVELRSCTSGNCVEICRNEGAVHIRQSTDPGTVISFTSQEWQDFLLGAKEGEFDL